MRLRSYIQKLHNANVQILWEKKLMPLLTLNHIVETSMVFGRFFFDFNSTPCFDSSMVGIIKSAFVWPQIHDLNTNPKILSLRCRFFRLIFMY